MDESSQHKVLDAIRSLHPSDAREVWQFVEMRILFHRQHLSPPTAAQWERLTEWQRIKVLWRASPLVAITRILRNIQSLIAEE